MKSRDKDELFEKLMKAYLAGKLSHSDAETLESLLTEDDHYQELYTNRVKCHVGTMVPKFESIKKRNLEALTNRFDFKKNTGRIYGWGNRYVRMVAATFVGFFIAFFYFYVQNNAATETPQFTTVSVPNGARTKIVLPDQTVVWLNAASTLKYLSDFNGDSREVYLEGEGFFDVKKNTSRPFFVRTNSLAVKVLGTTFNVKAYDEERQVAVSLITGNVEVAIPGETEVSLAPDQHLIYQKAEGQWEKSETMAVRSTWWTTGKLYFDKATLTDIMNALERKFDVDIVVKSTAMDGVHFSGSIDPELSVQEVLQYLDMDGKYTWQMQGHTITISDR